MRRRSEAIVILAHVIALILITLLLTGCESSVDPGKLRPPDASLMTEPRPAPPVKAGDNLHEVYADLRRKYGHETTRLRHLQRYVRTAIGQGGGK